MLIVKMSSRCLSLWNLSANKALLWFWLGYFILLLVIGVTWPIFLIIVSITKFSIVIGSPGAYLSCNRRVITWVSNCRCPIWTFLTDWFLVIGYPGDFQVNRPRSIYQYSNMAPRFSGQTSIFGVVFFVSKSLLGIEGQRKLGKFAILTRKPRSHARILIYRTWPITCALLASFAIFSTSTTDVSA